MIETNDNEIADWFSVDPDDPDLDVLKRAIQIRLARQVTRMGREFASFPDVRVVEQIWNCTCKTPLRLDDTRWPRCEVCRGELVGGLTHILLGTVWLEPKDAFREHVSSELKAAYDEEFDKRVISGEGTGELLGILKESR